MYADGRRGAFTGRNWRPDEGAEPGRLVLQSGSGGGSRNRWDGNFFVHPLPPDGPVTFVASWPEHAVSETQAELDGTAIRAAAARAVILWPEEPEITNPAARAWSSQTITAPKPDARGSEAAPGRQGAEDDAT